MISKNPVTRFLFSGFNSRGAEVPRAKKSPKKFCSRGVGGVDSESHFSKIVSKIFLSPSLGLQQIYVSVPQLFSPGCLDYNYV